MTATWNDCIGDGGSWLLQPLQERLRYALPLPVQQAVVPTVRRALLSGLPMDICLTAPTGSGKTLCYLLPMLRLVTECKKGVDHTRLRALVLVPTKTLGQQVLQEVTQLIRGTSIAAVSLCGETTVKEEADALVRRVMDVSQGSNTMEERSKSSIDTSCYYSRADIVIATPQRLLRHLDQTTGLSLVDLQLLVIDEADQVLAGNFSNFVTKVVERFEEEQRMRLDEYYAAVNTTGEARVLTQLTFRLHKILCSATLSSHIARISEVRLHNCRHFTLDGYGTDIRCEDEGEPIAMDAEAGAAGTMTKQEKSKNMKSKKNIDPPMGHRANAVRTSFALPPRLQEHIIFVEDWYRHAVLLKLVRAILAVQQSANLAKPNDAKESEGSDDEIEEKDRICEESEEFRVLGRRPRAHVAHQAASSSPSAYPPTRGEDDAGSRILVFCRSADEARVMGHFLLAAGVPAVEFTTLASESERRRALLKSSPTACVVASDALMRGVDVPNIGHVIMYSPPDTLSQYVHRAGRTARAMRAGHLHILLQKVGPSGSQEDGEVAAFKVLHAAVARSSAVRYERHFFMFDRPPAENDKADATAPKDKAQILIDEADELLKQTQTRLMGHWGSAMESVQSQTAQKKRQQREEAYDVARKKERKSLAS